MESSQNAPIEEPQQDANFNETKTIVKKELSENRLEALKKAREKANAVRSAAALQKKKEKWETDYYAQDPEHMKRLEEERTKPQKPKVFRGKRGGKYTKGKTKEGGSYRRYF